MPAAGAFRLLARGDHRVLTFTFTDRAAAMRYVPLIQRIRGRGGIGDLDIAAQDFRDDLATVFAKLRNAAPKG